MLGVNLLSRRDCLKGIGAIVGGAFAESVFSSPAYAEQAADPPLEQTIQEFITIQRSIGRLPRNERTSWLVYDLTSDSNPDTDEMLASINTDVPRQVASMIKPYVALAYFHEVIQGRQRYGQEQQLAAERMIHHSSNEDTNDFFEWLGGPATVHRILHANYGDMIPQLSIVENIPDDGRAYRNRASANDHKRFLVELWNRRLPMSDELLRLMSLPGRDRICTGVPGMPQDLTVYNKTGSTAMCAGDMGIIIGEADDGTEYPYVIVGIIDKEQRAEPYDPWINDRCNVIRAVSNRVYQFMRTRHGLRRG